MSLYLGDQIISGQATLVGESRNIGQIIPSAIPLTDAGLHLLDGSLIQGGGIYSAFVTKMAGLVSTYPDRFVTESAWQSAVSSKGVCDKFVYDSTNNTVRLPKYGTQIITKTSTLNISTASTVPVRGNGKVLGLTNGTQNAGLYFYENSDTTFLTNTFNTNVAQNVNYGTRINVKSSLGVTTDAAKSGMVAVTSGAVTANLTDYPLDCYYYIVIATSTKTDIEVDIDDVVSDLNGKADVDLTNVANTAGFRKLVEVYNNGASWYKVFREYNPQDGSYVGLWCEQGGGDITSSGNVNFLKPFKDTNYCLTGSIGHGTNSNTWEHFDMQKSSNSYFYQNCCFDGYKLVSWYACGYIN